MKITEIKSLNITVEGEEVDTLKATLRTVLNAENAVGFNRYPLSEKEIRLLTEIEKQITK